MLSSRLVSDGFDRLPNVRMVKNFAETCWTVFVSHAFFLPDGQISGLLKK